MAQIVQRLCYGLACNRAAIEQLVGITSRFFSMAMREAVQHVLFIPDDTTLKPDEVLHKIKNYIRSQRNIALDCSVAFEERKQAAGENVDSYLIAIKTLARDADLRDECLNRL